MISRDRVSSIRRARDGIYGRNPVFYCLPLCLPVALDSGQLGGVGVTPSRPAAPRERSEALPTDACGRDSRAVSIAKWRDDEPCNASSSSQKFVVLLPDSSACLDSRGRHLIAVFFIQSGELVSVTLVRRPLHGVPVSVDGV